MANMVDGDRAALWADFMASVSRDRSAVAINKTDLRAALDAADAWVSSNAASFNAALPLAARNGLTAAQKARLLAAVVAKRFERGA